MELMGEIEEKISEGTEKGRMRGGTSQSVLDKMGEEGRIGEKLVQRGARKELEGEGVVVLLGEGRREQEKKLKGGRGSWSSKE